MSTADFGRARREEMDRIRRSRPRYGYDARRRSQPRRNAERAQRDAALTTRTRIRLLALAIALTAAALIIIGWDHTRGPMNLPRPVEATDVTATPASHPEVSPR